METISNEQRAMELAYQHCVNNRTADQCYGAALDALEWKDKQFAEQKQQWIEKAWNWLTEQKGERTIDDFRNAME